MSTYLRQIFNLEAILKYKNAAAGVVGAAAAPFFETVMNSGKFWCYVLLLMIIIGDWISGTAAAKKNETYSSQYGIRAIPRTALILWIPFIGFVLDLVSKHAFGISQPGYMYYALTLMLAYHSLESMTANSARAGWNKWIPKSILNYVKSEIKAKIDRSEKQKGGGML